ncbi:hypothetical protein CD934_18945 [Streptomyces calvus]|uniref:Protein kinase domain-containing protein n=1 Tax=Streptomyces calvus TaxID=67282 RepID=A0A514JT41_9ACTN|nr:protein kinase [Streptomyces calvus]QDI70537.1 hypothetical protein CD934_18945 [Streptomyces calvus]
MDDYAGRVLADRYRLPLPPSDEYELTESRAFDTYSGQEVLIRQVPLPEVVEAEVLDAEGLPDGFTARDGSARRGGYGAASARGGTRRPADPVVRRAVEAAQAAAAIPDHPRLDQVFDVFADGGSLWIVSELVAARPLAALLAEEPLSPYRAAEVAADVLTALRVLHSYGWVHRNITARTVLVCDDGRVMLTGLAVGAAEEALCGYDPVPAPDEEPGQGPGQAPAQDPGPGGAAAGALEPLSPAGPAPGSMDDGHGPSWPPGFTADSDPDAARRAAIEARAGRLPGGAQGPGPLPPEGARPPALGGPYDGGGTAQQPGAGYGYPGPQGDPGTGYGAGSAPLPPQLDAGHGATSGPAAQGADGVYGPGAGHGAGSAPVPQPGAAYGGHPAPGAPPAPHSPPAPQGLPAPHGAPGAYGASDGSGYGGAPLPPAAPDGSEGATQFLPPVAAGGADEAATQYIPPVGPGALPPEMPAASAHDPETTRFLGHRAPQGAPAAGHPDAEATQYLAPVPDQGPARPYGAPPPGDGNRQPPAEFDNLFRSDDGPAGSTQQMPRPGHGRPPAGPAAHVPPGPSGPSASGRGGRGGGRSGSRVPLIAAVGVGIVVFGVGAGALMGSGDDDGGDNQTVSATAPAGEETSASPSVDPVREQAVELDKLLADSGDSRNAVIAAVGDVKACRDLGRAAQSLRDAAEQRNQLVTDLSALSVDRLPDHEALTTALTKAWKASASADDHYAAWADQVAGSKGKFCKKGQARTTAQTQAGNRASGTATTEKAKAAKLWNAIAREYGLTERRPTQL